MKFYKTFVNIVLAGLVFLCMAPINISAKVLTTDDRDMVFSKGEKLAEVSSYIYWASYSSEYAASNGPACDKKFTKAQVDEYEKIVLISSGTVNGALREGHLEVYAYKNNASLGMCEQIKYPSGPSYSTVNDIKEVTLPDDYDYIKVTGVSKGTSGRGDQYSLSIYLYGLPPGTPTFNSNSWHLYLRESD